jgi:hypothetical protein
MPSARVKPSKSAKITRPKMMMMSPRSEATAMWAENWGYTKEDVKKLKKVIAKAEQRRRKQYDNYMKMLNIEISKGENRIASTGFRNLANIAFGNMRNRQTYTKNKNGNVIMKNASPLR